MEWHVFYIISMIKTCWFFFLIYLWKYCLSRITFIQRERRKTRSTVHIVRRREQVLSARLFHIGFQYPQILRIDSHSWTYLSCCDTVDYNHSCFNSHGMKRLQNSKYDNNTFESFFLFTWLFELNVAYVWTLHNRKWRLYLHIVIIIKTKLTLTYSSWVLQIRLMKISTQPSPSY